MPESIGANKSIFYHIPKGMEKQKNAIIRFPSVRARLPKTYSFPPAQNLTSHFREKWRQVTCDP